MKCPFPSVLKAKSLPMPGHPPALRPVKWLLLVLLAILSVLPARAPAEDLNTIDSFRLVNDMAVVTFAEDPGKYYLLQYSDDLTHWGPLDMSLGTPSTLEIAPGVTKGYFRAIPYSKFAPLDTDGDGMDDLYELNHAGLLNPLDPSDGSKLTPGGSGLTNYQTYLKLFQITSYKILQLESREVSLFNFGSPSATFEANSREQSIFNFGSPSATFEANSKEISVYNGEAVPYSDLLQIETREVSVFNFGGAAPGSNPAGPSATAEAISREVSVFNGEAVPPSDLLQIETREVSVFNFGSPSAPIEAISREVSVLNFDEP